MDRKNSLSSVDRFNKYYDTTHIYRGVAIILNHKYFDSTKEATRHGTEVDCERLETVLKGLQFHVIVKHDLKKKQVLALLDEVANMDHTDNDCLSVTVLTHGKSEVLYAKDGEYSVEELWKPFITCKTLIGKPKLFFLQACRGGNFDDGIAVLQSNFSTNLRGGMDMIDSMVENIPITFAIPSMCDILVMYSVTNGSAAWRNSDKGTWFIQSLCDELLENPLEDLLTILTGVSRRVAFNYQSNSSYLHMDGKKQIPSINTMLIKTLYFTPKKSH